VKIQPFVLALMLSSTLALPTSSPGTQGSPEFQINTTLDFSTQKQAHVAFDAAGNFVVTWSRRYGDDRRILARRYDRAASPLGDEFQVSSTNPSSTHPGYLSSPHVAPAADGSFVVVWFGKPEDIAEGTIFAQRFDSAGASLGNELVLHTFPIASIFDFSGELTSDPAGNFVVIWTATVGGGTDLFARRFDPSCNPLGDEFRINSPTSGDESAPVAASDAAGNFVVAWSGPHDSGRRLLVRRYDAAGQALSGEIQVTDDTTTGHCDEHAVLSEAAGHFVVAWQEYSGMGIFGRRYDGSGQPLDEKFVVSPTALSVPAIAGDASGGFLVVWRDEWGPEEDRYHFGQHFSITGEPEGAQFRISLSLPSDAPVTAGDGTGNYMVVYPVETSLRHDLFGRYLGRAERAGTLQFLPDSFSVLEGHTAFSGIEGGTAALTVLRTGGSQGEVSVEFLVDGGSATPGEDFVTPSPIVTFPEGGEDTQSLVVELVDDELPESDEIIAWRLANPTGGAMVVEPVTAELTLFENDFSEPGSRPLPLGPVIRVNGSPGGDHFGPAVAVAPSGEFVVAWTIRVEGLYIDYNRVVAQLYDRLGVAQGPEIAVSLEQPEEDPHWASGPAVAFDRDGSCMIVWSETWLEGSWRVSIRGRTFSPSGEALTEDFVIASTYSDGTRSWTSLGHAGIVRGADDRFFVTWNRHYQDWLYNISNSVYGQLIDRCGELLSDVFSAYGGDPYYYYDASGVAPVAAAAPAGGYLLTWWWWEDPLRLLAQRFDGDGEPQGESFELGDGLRPAITVDGSGTFVVAWEDEPYDPTDVFTRRFTSGGQPQGEAVRANLFTLGSQGGAGIAADAAGNFVVVWESEALRTSDSGPRIAQDGSGSGVFGRRFNAAGEPVGGEFPIPTETRGDQRRPVVAGHANGEFVVVWESERDDGGFDILARRFSPNACVEDAVTLCLGDGRFRVRAIWRDFVGNTGQGRARALTADTGYFWFFNQDNVEVVLKVLDGRLFNGHFWVFYGALSNVEYTLTVTDTTNGATREYVNPLHQFASVGDTAALPGKGAPRSGGGSRRPAAAAKANPAPRQGGCVADPVTLCLNDERFRISVNWRDFVGNTGVGYAEPLTGDTGYFWFFNDANVEVVIKALDGTGINDHYWVFYGALSNVEYTITVTDTATGDSRQYFNPSGQFASVGDTEAFPADGD